MADERRGAALSWLAPPVVQPQSRDEAMAAQWKSGGPPTLGKNMVKNHLINMTYHGQAELDCWQPSPTGRLMVRNRNGTLHGP